MTLSRNRALLLALPAALALALGAAGCGDAGGSGTAPTDEQAAPDNENSRPGDEDDAGGAAGGSTMRVYTVPEAKTADVDGSLQVVGMLIDEGDGWRLCQLALESYPPQCGGEALIVEDLDTSDLALEESGEVRWQSDATLVGEVDGDTLTVTGSPAAS